MVVIVVVAMVVVVMVVVMVIVVVGVVGVVVSGRQVSSGFSSISISKPMTTQLSKQRQFDDWFKTNDKSMVGSPHLLAETHFPLFGLTTSFQG